jgi:iron-sulfur cluster repair protein YtfE (RIC family)
LFRLGRGRRFQPISASNCRTPEAWKAKLTVLQENLEHHIAEEEQGLFPKAEKTLSAKQLEHIEKELAEAKKR